MTEKRRNKTDKEKKKISESMKKYYAKARKRGGKRYSYRPKSSEETCKRKSKSMLIAWQDEEKSRAMVEGRKFARLKRLERLFADE